MSGAPATRQRRSTKVVTKKKRSKASSPPPKKPVPAGKSRRPTSAPPAAGPVAAPARPKPKTRSAPPPVDLEIDPDVLEFIKAIDDYRAAHDRPFPTWSEVLYVLKGLGYRRQR